MVTEEQVLQGLEANESFRQATPDQQSRIKAVALSRLKPRTPLAPPQDDSSISLPAIAGGIIGGVGAGIVTKHPVAVEAAAAGGAALGSLGESAFQLATDSPLAPPTKVDAGLRAVKEGALSAVGGTVVRGAVSAVSKLAGGRLEFFSRTVTPEGREAIDFLKERTSLANPLTPAEATTNNFLDHAQAIAESSFFGGGRLFKFKQARNEAIGSFDPETRATTGLADDLAESFSARSDPATLSRLFTETVEGNLTLARQPASVLYNSLIKEADDKGLRVFITDVKKSVMNDAKRLSEAGRLGSASERSNIISAVQSLDPRMSVGGLIEFRKELGATVNRLAETPGLGKDPAVGLGGSVMKAIDSVLDSELGRQDAKLLSTYRQANKIWKQGSARFNAELLGRTIKKLGQENGGNPDSIAKALFRPNTGEAIRESLRATIPPQFTEEGFIRAVNVTRQAVAPVVWQKIQRAGIEEMLLGSMKDGVIDGARLFNKMAGIGGIREKGLRLAFGRQGANDLFRFAKAIRTVQERQGDGTGRVLVQLTQGGALLGVGQGIIEGEPSALSVTSGAILLGPAMIGRILTNPRASKALIEGLTLKTGSEAHRRAIAGRIFAGLVGPELADAERERAVDRMPTVQSFGSASSPLSPAFVR